MYNLYYASVNKQAHHNIHTQARVRTNWCINKVYVYLHCDTKWASSMAGWLSRDNRSTRRLPLWCRSGRSSFRAGAKRSERLKHTSCHPHKYINSIIRVHDNIIFNKRSVIPKLNSYTDAILFKFWFLESKFKCLYRLCFRILYWIF